MTNNPLPAVYKTRQMFDVEQANTGRDIRLILIDLYNRHGSQSGVAQELGISQPTIADWFAMLGIKTVTNTKAVLAA